MGAHSHNHSHHHHSPKDRSQFRKLFFVFLLTFTFMIAEVIGGLLSNSLALLADAGHMLGDATSLSIALVAAWVVQNRVSARKTFGFYRMEILAAFVNGLLLMIVASLIMIEGWERFQDPAPINVAIMLPVAVGGLVVNIVAAFILHADQQTNMNIKGAYLHVLGDLLGSVGAISASLLILFFNWNWADPMISAFIALLVFISALRLIRDATNILLEGSPVHVNVEEVEREILTYDGIQAVHNLHVWNINVEIIVLTAHLVVKPEAFSAETLCRVQALLKQKFGLSHVTLQLEVS